MQKARSQFESYLASAESEFLTLHKDNEFLQKLPGIFQSDQPDIDLIRSIVKLDGKPFTLFILDNQELVFWSNDHVRMPDLDQLSTGNPYYQDRNNFYRALYGQFTKQDKTFKTVGLVPIRLGSEPNPYKHIGRSIPASITLSDQSGTPVMTSNGEEFLFINNPNTKPLSRNEVGILLLLYGLVAIALAALVQQISKLLIEKVGLWYGIAFFVITAAGIRFITYLLDFTQPFNALPIFNPSLTAPAFHPSLGDLLINILIFLWITIFLINQISLRIPVRMKLSKQLMLCFVGYLFIFTSLIWLSRFCKDLIQKTSINFDFESVFNLDILSISALVGIILLLFALFIWSAKMVSLIQQFAVPLRFKITAGIAALLTSLPILFNINPSIALFQFALVAGIFILLMDVFLEVKTPNFTWIVLWLVVLSGFSSILLFKYNKDKDMVLRTMIAKQLTEEVDTVALREMNQMLQVVDEPLHDLANSPMVLSMLSETIIKGSTYLGNYYRLSFPPTTSQDFVQLDFNVEGRMYYQNPKQLDQYLTFVTLSNGQRLALQFEKKNSNPYTPVPSLLPVSNFKGIGALQNYEYAIYKDGKCIERSSSDYKMILEDDLGGDPVTMQYKLGWSDLIYHNGTYLTMVGRKLTGLIKPVSLFSYLFVVIVIIIFFLLLLNTFIPYLPKEFNFTFSNQISLRNKIQVSVLALIILSFIIIGIVTVVYFQSNAEKTNEDRLKEKASALQFEIQEEINRLSLSRLDSQLIGNLQNLALQYSTHIQIFNINGQLLETSDPEALKRGYLADLMSFDPLIRMRQLGESILIHEETNQKGEQEQSAYFSFRNQNGQLLGYAGLPVYPGRADAWDRVKDFMGALLNVYVFLLLIAGAFALAVANSITRPMTVLGQKLKDFKLGRSNEPLQWKTSDELGILIQEYNQMIVKLDESADLLAQTEREVAWREMAKQVAHEIKNPLTPMKLSIQHLQHAIQNADPIESKQLVQRVAITLIEQIDNLSKIAAEFSTFAKMPKPQYESIVLNDLVASVHDLFKKRDDMDFNLYVPIDEIYVNADKSHLLRVLNNLIKNAIQAIPPSRRGAIDIKLEKRGEKAVIQVSDNGKGISREMREKVFYPNFTTKTSGTGLGLAISKNIVESFGGRIYFETEENVGTKFFFELPLLKSEELEFALRYAG